MMLVPTLSTPSKKLIADDRRRATCEGWKGSVDYLMRDFLITRQS